MRSWTTKEARLVLEWARTAGDKRSEINELAGRLAKVLGPIAGDLQFWNDQPGRTRTEVFRALDLAVRRYLELRVDRTIPPDEPA